MNELWLNIQDYEQRKNIVFILCCAGHSVRIVDKFDKDILTHDCWVVFDIPECNIKNKEVLDNDSYL